MCKRYECRTTMRKILCPLIPTFRSTVRSNNFFIERGKQAPDRRGYSSLALFVRFTSRPHITVRVYHVFDAMIDTGSEASFVNQHTACAVHVLNFALHSEERVVLSFEKKDYNRCLLA